MIGEFLWKTLCEVGVIAQLLVELSPCLAVAPIATGGLIVLGQHIVRQRRYWCAPLLAVKISLRTAMIELTSTAKTRISCTGLVKAALTRQPCQPKLDLRDPSKSIYIKIET